MSEQPTWTSVPETTDLVGLIRVLNTRIPRFSRAIAPTNIVLGGNGVPTATLGSNGNYYLRADAPGGLYFKNAGVWALLPGAWG